MIDRGQSGPDRVDRTKQSLVKWWHNIHQGLVWSREYPINILVDRPHICETIGNLRTITLEVLGNHLSPTIVGYRKSDRVLFLNMFENSRRSKVVGRWSSWSSEGPLKVALSRLSSGAIVNPLQLSAKDRAKGVTMNR